MNWLALVSALAALARNLVEMLQQAGKAARADRQAKLEARANAYRRLAKAVRARQKSGASIRRDDSQARGGNRRLDSHSQSSRLHNDKYRRKQP